MANLTQYLYGLQWQLFPGLPDIYITSHHISRKGFRYFASYDKGTANKNLIFQKLNQVGDVGKGKIWDWHHIVAKTHLAPLFSAHDCKFKYDFEWPTVMIDSAGEHDMLHTFITYATPQQLTKPIGTPPIKGEERRNYISQLKKYYTEAYEGDHNLRIIAQNVLSSIP